MNYERHYLSKIGGDMSEDSFALLRSDIDLNGTWDPIYLYEGLILDGWHRYRACFELNKLEELDIKQYDGIDPAGLVLSKNNRKHQTPAQRAIFISEIIEWQKGSGRRSFNVELIKSCPRTRLTIPEAAKIAGVAESSISRAKTILNNDHLKTAVIEGKIGLQEAAYLAKNPTQPHKIPKKLAFQQLKENYHTLKYKYDLLLNELKDCNDDCKIKKLI